MFAQPERVTAVGTLRKQEVIDLKRGNIVKNFLICLASSLKYATKDLQTLQCSVC